MIDDRVKGFILGPNRFYFLWICFIEKVEKFIVKSRFFEDFLNKKMLVC